MVKVSGKRKTAEEILDEVESGSLPAHRAARKLLYHSGDFQAAQQLARKTFKKRPKSHEHEEIGNLYLQAGNDFLARNTYLACLLLYGRLQTTNLLHADVPVARAFVDDERKLLYIPIPKCASSTIKNYLSYGLTGETHKEAVHRKMLEYYRFVTPADLKTRYADYFKFAVVRDPVDRVASFYSRNVTTGAIRRSAYQVRKFRGIPTKPTAEQFVDHFEEYRRYFLGVRHHTDKQIKYIHDFLEPETGLQVFGMGGVQTIHAKLNEAFGKEIADERFMVTDKKKEEKKRDPVWENLRESFKRDMTVFAPIINKEGDPTQPYTLAPRKVTRNAFFQGPQEGLAIDLDGDTLAAEEGDSDSEADTGAAID